MSKKKKTPFQWVEQKMRVLLPDNTDELARISSGVYYPINYWSLLKLIFLASYIYDVYSKIISRFFGENYFYIDLLCNSGINKLKLEEDSKTEDVVIGSPLLGAMSDLHFKKMYFIDAKKQNTDTLEERLMKLKDKKAFSEISYVVHWGDSNELIDTVLEEIRSYKNYHILAFIDNEGLDVNWRTIEKLLPMRCDLIINYPASEVKRVRGQARVFDNHESLTKFFGVDVVKSDIDENRLLDFYKGRLCASNRVCEDILIKGTKSFHYDIIVCCRRTIGGNRFLSLVRYEKEHIEKLTPALVRNALNQIKGRLKKLSEFY